MRCEKRKQKDATQQQAELTEDQIAERRAKADAFAQVLRAGAGTYIVTSDWVAAGCVQTLPLTACSVFICTGRQTFIINTDWIASL